MTADRKSEKVMWTRGNLSTLYQHNLHSISLVLSAAGRDINISTASTISSNLIRSINVVLFCGKEERAGGIR